MATSEKLDKDILKGHPTGIDSSPILFIFDKSGGLKSAAICFGCTVLHARDGGTTLYHLSHKDQCAPYMSGMAKNATEAGFVIGWGYSNRLNDYCIAECRDLGMCNETGRRPRVFTAYHLGGDLEQFGGGKSSPLGDNLMDLLGIEDANGDATSHPLPSNPVAHNSVSEPPVAPHRVTSFTHDALRAYVQSLQA